MIAVTVIVVIVVVGGFFTYRKMLDSENIKEGYTRISFVFLPLKIELQFKKELDKSTKKST